MSDSAADRNLLFGLLALQNNFISRDQLVAAFGAWVADKSRPLRDILLAQQTLDPATCDLLAALVQRHLALHGNDAEKSLAAISSVASARHDLGQLADPQLDASLMHVTARADADPYATRMPSQGDTAAGGTRFRILYSYKKGGMGQVSVAMDAELRREVALKEIQDPHADHPDVRNRFVREAEITGGLEHPGIVPVYGLGTYGDGRPFYAMKFIQGDSLKAAIEGQTLELREMLGRLVDVCNAMQYAHDRGVLHRDLKPGNIMLGKYGETLVVDWGLAKPLAEHEPSLASAERKLVPSLSQSGSMDTLPGSRLGTPQYMSPEQAAGRLDELGPASDVYSLGATLYHVLAGQPPLEGLPLGDLMQRVQHGDVPPPSTVHPQVPPALEAICLKAMQLHPENRYAAPKLLADDLEHWLADEPIAAYHEPFSIRAGRWMRKHPARVAALATAIAVATLGATIGLIVVTQKNSELRVLTKKEVAARQDADKNFALASSGLDRFVAAFLGDEPEPSPTRQYSADTLDQMLTQATQYADALRTQRSSDDSLPERQALAVFRVGRIQEELEAPAEALRHYEDARQQQQKLVDARPDDAPRQRALGTTLNALGRLAHSSDRKQAKQWYEQATRLREKLAKADPANVEDQRLWANSVMNLGVLSKDDGQLDDALTQQQQAQQIREQAARTSDEAKLRRDLAKGYYNLAVLQRDRLAGCEDAADWDRARLVIAQAAQGFAGLPQTTSNRYDRARCDALFCSIEYKLHHDEAAGKLAEQAHEQFRRLIAENPAIPGFRHALAQAHLTQGAILADRQQHSAAMQQYQAAGVLLRRLHDDYGDKPAYVRDIAMLLYNMGRIKMAYPNTTDDARKDFNDALGWVAKLQQQDPGNKSHAELKARIEADLQQLP